MVTYRITSKRLLDWYFEEEGTTESREIKEDIADFIIAQLFKKHEGTYTTKDVFEKCNHGSIRLSFLEGFEVNDENYNIQLKDLNHKFEVLLIN